MENKKIRILAIDDNRDNLVTLRALIQEDFPEAAVSTAQSGREGLELAALEDPDIIFLDIIMPAMDGYEVCLMLKADQKLRDIPVVFLTAVKGDKESRIKALESGAEAFLAKPIDEVELTAQIRAMMKIRASNLQKRNEKESLAALVEEKTRELQESNRKTLRLLETVKREQTLIRAIFDSIPGYLYVYDEDGRLIRWNRKHETMTGYSAEELSHMTLEKWFDQEDFVKVDATVHDVFEKGYGEVEAQLILKSGEKMLVRSSGAPLVWDGHKYFAGIGVDITEQKKVQEAFLESQSILKAAFENSQAGIAIADAPDGKLRYVNKAGLLIRDKSEQEIVQDIDIHKYAESWRIMHLDGTPYADEDVPLARAILKGESCSEEFIIRRDSLEDRYVLANAAPIRDSNNAIKAGIVVFLDITERKKTESELLYLSYHDHLTELHNRRYFEEELVRLDTVENLPLSVIMCDVNGLKLVNDSFGHDSGDALLRNAAKTIGNACRKGDLIARIGGDEFVVVLPKTSDEETEKIANHIKELAAMERVANMELSISYGYDTKTTDAQSIVEIVANAENHMYRHKLYERSSIRSKTIDLIMNTLFEKSNREAMHSNRVSRLCQSIASKMGFNRDAVNQMKIAGLIHDIGKIGVDEKILNKPGQLTTDERRDIERHPEIGWKILSSTNEFSELAQFVLNHHERWDGSGYPNGLEGEAIQVEARIIGVADAYDAMTSDRSYKKGMSQEDAVIELKRCSGTQFDPNIVDVFVNLVLPGTAGHKRGNPRPI